MRIPKGGIAFFDSGIGGLTVLAACKKYFKEGIFYYYGDNVHAPYGNLPPEKIRRYVLRAFRTFRRLRVRAAVVACNTATAVCIEELREKFSFPIVGAEPAVCTAAAKGGEVLVLATRATVESERLRRLCDKAAELFPEARIESVACDYLAGEIERHLGKLEYDYTPFFPKGAPSSVVLGCTHYIYIEEQIRAYYDCEVYHGNDGIARRLVALVNEENRDGRPLWGKNSRFLGRLTTQDRHKSKKGTTKTNANKRLCYKLKKRSKMPKNRGDFTIFFLGKGKKGNKNICKQMFACDFSG